MTPEQEYQQLYERMYHLCQENGWGDPFSYARSREIHLAGLLGHKIAVVILEQMPLMKMEEQSINQLLVIRLMLHIMV